MENNIYIPLDCGVTLGVRTMNSRFQVFEMIEGQAPQNIGESLGTVLDVVEALRHYDLTQQEISTLDEFVSAVKSTDNKIKEYFEYHSEYLANTAM
nr:MAG TPA: hypothetical protein [Caudoviricetes sp.]